MHHYVYKITEVLTGNYYIGLRSSILDPTIDPYMGSGRWIKHCEKMYGKNLQDFGFEKVIIEVYDSRKLASNGEKHHVSNRYIEDHLCMNRCAGGDFYEQGVNHPHYKKEYFDLWDHNNKIAIRATVYDLKKIYGISPTCATNITTDKRISSKGISLIKYKNAPIAKERTVGLLNGVSDKNIYHFWDHANQVELHLTKVELCKRLGIENKNINKLFNGDLISTGGVCLYENKNKPYSNKSISISNSDKNVYLFVVNDVTYELTRKECMEMFNIPASSMSYIIRGRTIKNVKCKGKV